MDSQRRANAADVPVGATMLVKPGEQVTTAGGDSLGWLFFDFYEYEMLHLRRCLMLGTMPTAGFCNFV